MAITRSELIERMTELLPQLSAKEIELAVKSILQQMTLAMCSGDRVEVRRFGSFSLHYRAARIGRNPKTGASVQLKEKYVPYFKPGKELKARVNQGL